MKVYYSEACDGSVIMLDLYMEAKSFRTENNVCADSDSQIVTEVKAPEPAPINVGGELLFQFYGQYNTELCYNVIEEQSQNNDHDILFCNSLGIILVKAKTIELMEYRQRIKELETELDEKGDC